MKSCLYLFIFLPFALGGYCQQPDYQEIVAKSNTIMENIYNDLWLVKDGYEELSNLSRQNIYSTTKELPPQYRNIKNIRLENRQARSEIKTLFMDNRYSNYIQDEVYICFSDFKKVLGIGSEPNLCIYMKNLGLYLLFFSTSQNEYLKNTIMNILTRNARAAVSN
jgi:hypothetical protein